MQHNDNKRIHCPGGVFPALTAVLLFALNACDGPPTTTLAPVVEADLPPPPAEIVDANAQWETVVSGYVYSDSPAVNAAGEIYYSANTQNKIFQLDAADRVRMFDDNTALTMGLMFGPDGRLYGCRNSDAQIVAYDITRGRREVILQGKLTPIPGRPNAPAEFCNDLVVNSEGKIWFTDRVNQGVVYIPAKGESRVVAQGFRPNGIALSPDEKILAVTDSNVPMLHAFEVAADGSLTEIRDYFAPVRMIESLANDESTRGRPGTNGMTIDSDGRFYVTSFYGIQVFDRRGQYVGVIEAPKGYTSNITFGGPELNILYATGRKGVYRIPTKVRGAPYFLNARSQTAAR